MESTTSPTPAAATPAATVTLVLPDLTHADDAPDLELVGIMTGLADARKRIDAASAHVAGIVAKRSARELGYDGLAQRAGARTPVDFVSRTTGISVSDARALVAAGEILGGETPWLASVARGVESGEVSVGVAAAIRNGLGAPSERVAADDLADAAIALVDRAGSLPPEKVAQAARQIRDELDSAGVGEREAALRERRYLRFIPRPDGMLRVDGLVDPEQAALLKDAADLITAPRRGVRFVNPDDVERAARVKDDPRTSEQLLLDAFVDLVRIGSAADTGKVFGTRKPGVRVHVTAEDLNRREGVARIEGQSVPVSIPTAERLICADGYIPIIYDADGIPVNAGRTQRLFSEKQKLILAADWGGCGVDGCDCPPSWCEAHHIEQWERDRGESNLDNGILLCRFHHLLLHNNAWEISGDGLGQMWMTPPPGDPTAQPRKLTKKGLLQNPTHSVPDRLTA